MTVNIPEIIVSSETELIDLFKDFHANPELGFEENRTAKIIEKKLNEYGVDQIKSKIGITGIVGIIKGKKSSNRRIGIRADMDALPIHEKTKLSYASNVAGKMHACGHDAHIVMLLGAAKYLAATRSFDGTAILIFQPAEEGLGGASKMINDGVLKEFPCDEIYGIHNWPNHSSNKVEICVGPAMAGAEPAAAASGGRPMTEWIRRPKPYVPDLRQLGALCEGNYQRLHRLRQLEVAGCPVSEFELHREHLYLGRVRIQVL